MTALKAETVAATNAQKGVRESELVLLGGRGIAPALQRAHESGKPSLINVWVDPDAYAPGTMNQTMHK